MDISHHLTWQMIWIIDGIMSPLEREDNSYNSITSQRVNVASLGMV